MKKTKTDRYEATTLNVQVMQMSHLKIVSRFMYLEYFLIVSSYWNFGQEMFKNLNIDIFFFFF